MPVAVPLVLILLAGVGMGTVFFGGLWLTVRSARSSSYPAIFIVGSFWIRTAIVVAGFLWVTDGRWQNAMICLAGFAAARLFFTRFVARLESHLWT